MNEKICWECKKKFFQNKLRNENKMKICSKKRIQLLSKRKLTRMTTHQTFLSSFILISLKTVDKNWHFSSKNKQREWERERQNKLTVISMGFQHNYYIDVSAIIFWWKIGTESSVFLQYAAFAECYLQIGVFWSE